MLRLLKHLAPYRWPIAAALVLIFVQSLTELYLPTLMAGIVDTGVSRGDTDFILWAGGRMLLVTLGGVVCSVLSSWLASRVSASFGRDLRSRMFEKATGLSLHAFDRFGAATLRGLWSPLLRRSGLLERRVPRDLPVGDGGLPWRLLRPAG